MRVKSFFALLMLLSLHLNAFGAPAYKERPEDVTASAEVSTEDTADAQIDAESGDPVAATEAADAFGHLEPKDLQSLIALLNDPARLEELKNNLTLLDKASGEVPAVAESTVLADNAQNIADGFTARIRSSMNKAYLAITKLRGTKVLRDGVNKQSLLPWFYGLGILFVLLILWARLMRVSRRIQQHIDTQHETRTEEYNRRSAIMYFATYNIVQIIPMLTVWLVAVLIMPQIQGLPVDTINMIQAFLPVVVLVLLLASAFRLLLSLRFKRIRLVPLNKHMLRFLLTKTYKFVWFPLMIFLMVYRTYKLENAPTLEIRMLLQLISGFFFLWGLYRFMILLSKIIENSYQQSREEEGQSQFIWFYDWLVYSWPYLGLSYLLLVGVQWFMGFTFAYTWLVKNTIGLMLLVLAALNLWRFIYCISMGLAKPLSPLNSFLTKAPIIIATLVLALMNFGINIYHFFDGEAGNKLLTQLITLTVLFAIWYVIRAVLNSMINKYLTTTKQDGTFINENARLRTVLPLIKNIIMISFSVVIILFALASVGINITPLLAGAGVIGIAIGFGSQKLVADFITGLFNLIEDTMQVGDVVELNGLSGTVDNLSVRSVRLRDASGNVHTLPFSSVEQVSNLTREFSFAVIDIGVSYDADVDYVFEVLIEIGEQMRSEQPWSFYLMEDLEVFGVDSFGDSSVNLRVRFKTRPGKQFGVRREFNRRIKIAFDEKGISIPFPQRVVYHMYPQQDANAKDQPENKKIDPIPIVVVDESSEDD